MHTHILYILHTTLMYVCKEAGKEHGEGWKDILYSYQIPDKQLASVPSQGAENPYGALAVGTQCEA